MNDDVIKLNYIALFLGLMISFSVCGMDSEIDPNCIVNNLPDDLIVLIAENILQLDDFRLLSSREKKKAVESLGNFFAAIVGLRPSAKFKSLVSVCTKLDCQFKCSQFECEAKYTLEEMQMLFEKIYGYKTSTEIFWEDVDNAIDATTKIARATPAKAYAAHLRFQNLGPVGPYQNCLVRGATSSIAFLLPFFVLGKLTDKYPATRELMKFYFFPALYTALNDSNVVTTKERIFVYYLGIFSGGYLFCQAITQLRKCGLIK